MKTSLVIRFLLFFVSFVQIISIALDTLSKILQIKQSIDNNNSTIHIQSVGDQRTGASMSFINRFWEQWTGDIPVLIFYMRFGTHAMGNFLGAYFDSISCALETGTHFITVKETLYGHKKSRDELFYDAFPRVFVNPTPISNITEAISRVKAICKCKRYCWKRDDLWSKQIKLIREIMTQGLRLHLSKKDILGRTPSQNGLQLSNFDISNTLSGTHLPLIPDVAIHYRCSDNIYGGMGLMAFRPIIETIPVEAKYIYVFTEFGQRLTNRIFEKTAPIILKSLFDHIVKSFPNATVAIKRGGDEFTNWAQFLFANITYCSPSTYCFWPALARNKTTYMPGTSYIASSLRYPNNHTFIHENYHWVENPRLYSNFSKNSTVDDILNTLSWDLPML